MFERVVGLDAVLNPVDLPGKRAGQPVAGVGIVQRIEGYNLSKSTIDH
jgi:hypothetical protein